MSSCGSPSVITYKLLMAVTGVIFIGYLLVHSAGISLVFLGPDVINGYAAKLREVPILLWGARLVLLPALIVHIYAAVCLTRLNQAARPQSYRKAVPQKATWASQNAMFSGLVLLAFIIYHIAHLTFRWTHAEAFAGLGEFDVYGMMTKSFTSPFVTLFYVIAVCLLFFHLQHGIVASLRTMGLGHASLLRKMERLGPAVGLAVGLGFCAAPVAILLGLLH
jgi:succinate dehydrogenase / fumarate reductase cytochrome b subunit